MIQRETVDKATPFFLLRRQDESAIIELEKFHQQWALWICRGGNDESIGKFELDCR
jgi:hypothetical protein